MNNDNRYWFAAKPQARGWGWGLPVRWQGWVVFAVYFVSVVGAATYLAPRNALACSVVLVVATACLIAICNWKGEPQALHRP